MGLLKVVFVFVKKYFSNSRYFSFPGQACNENIEAQARRAFPKIEAHLGRAQHTANYGNWFDELLTSITHVCQHLFLCIPKHSSGTAIITFI